MSQFAWHCICCLSSLHSLCALGGSWRNVLRSELVRVQLPAVLTATKIVEFEGQWLTAEQVKNIKAVRRRQLEGRWGR
jgi:hypothetical protein